MSREVYLDLAKGSSSSSQRADSSPSPTSYASTSKQPARALRIALPNLFSTSYGDVSMTVRNPSVSLFNTFPKSDASFLFLFRSSQQMYRFLHSLRSLLRSSRTAAMITLPAHLCQKGELRERLMWGTDAVVELEGFGCEFSSDAAISLSFSAFLTSRLMSRPTYTFLVYSRSFSQPMQPSLFSSPPTMVSSTCTLRSISLPSLLPRRNSPLS